MHQSRTPQRHAAHAGRMCWRPGNTHVARSHPFSSGLSPGYQKLSSLRRRQLEHFQVVPPRVPETGRQLCSFRGSQFVSGRRAMARGRHLRAGNPKTVLRIAAFGSRGKSRTEQRPVQEVAGTVSGEHTSCSIGTMRPWRQTRNQQTRRVSPNEGTGLPQYSQSRNARRFIFAASRMCAISPGTACIPLFAGSA